MVGTLSQTLHKKLFEKSFLCIFKNFYYIFPKTIVFGIKFSLGFQGCFLFQKKHP